MHARGGPQPHKAPRRARCGKEEFGNLDCAFEPLGSTGVQSGGPGAPPIDARSERLALGPGRRVEAKGAGRDRPVRGEAVDPAGTADAADRAPRGAGGLAPAVDLRGGYVATCEVV